VRAISLWQPWASLWASGRKVHETRHWSTDYRGPLAIHAAQRLEEVSMELDEIMLAQFGAMWRRELPRGAIVGTCNLVACVATGTNFPASLDDEAAGDWSDGRFAWRGDGFRLLARPIEWKGRQGFFSVPDSILREAA
jgi:activating signal cointegrator 1